MKELFRKRIIRSRPRVEDPSDVTLFTTNHRNKHGTNGYPNENIIESKRGLRSVTPHLKTDRTNDDKEVRDLTLDRVTCARQKTD